MVSIKDISKKTGYSITTVSRALNDYSDVNKETKKIIKNAAKELNYVPNLLAKKLVNQSSKTIGFITNKLAKRSLVDNFALRVFLGMFDEVHAYEVILIHYNSDFFHSKSFDSIVKERQLDGAIVQGFDAKDPFVTQVLDSTCPTILVDIGYENETTSYVGSDIRMAFKLGMSSIIDAGFKEITMIIGKKESFVTQEWTKEIHRFIKENHDQKINLLDGRYEEDIAYNEVKKDLLQGRKSEVYFCLSDLMALGVYKALEEFDISVPEQASVLGYDDIIVSSYITPRLSTISQDWEKLGSEAVNQLIKLIEGKEVTPKMLDVELKMRESFKKKVSE